MSTDEQNKITAEGGETDENPKKSEKSKRLTSISKYEKEKRNLRKTIQAENEWEIKIPKSINYIYLLGALSIIGVIWYLRSGKTNKLPNGIP